MLSMLIDLSLSDKNQYGTKASSLGELMNNGEEVPNGFALSSEFFIEFLKYNNFHYSIQDYVACNEEIYNFILNGQFSCKMETSLLRFFNNIQTKEVQEKFVVRSSALSEDNDTYSMAGMFSSYINLNSFEEVKNCIKKCYASLFNDKVIEYFVNNNLIFEDLKMCIIVQNFILGDYSGVNFSVDTIDMNEDIMHINAVNGLCDNYVSGKASSAFYKINKKNGEILDKKIPENFLSPSKNIIKRLYEITLKIERIFGKYQDVEWTITNDKIYILQARAITTFKIKNFQFNWQKEEDDNYTWYRESDIPYKPLINELNLIQGDALNSGFYATGFQDFYTEYCVQNGYFFYRDKKMLNREYQEQNFLAMIDELHNKYKNIFQDVVLPELLCIKKDLDNYIRKELSPQEVLIFLEKSISYMNFLSANHQPVTHGCDYLDTFMEYYKSINDDYTVEDFYDLVFNVSILNKEREFYIAMANEVNSNAILNKMFKNCQYNELLYSRLTRISESKNLLKLIKDYIALFGICNLDIDVNSPYLEPLLMEAPSKVIGHIRGFLDLNIKNFKASIENSLKNKKRIKANILRNLDKKEVEEFLNKLTLAEKAYLARDDHHYYFERMTKSYLRLALGETTKILMKNKQIQNKSDIYFLTLNEIKMGLLNSTDFRELINERKKLYNYQKKLFAPPTIGRNHTENTDCINENNEQDKEGFCEDAIVLKGLSGLRKKVNGKVKIGMPAYLEENSILVVPFTRCGELEPIVNFVKGIIVEVGSPFEHLGILAREMNIPVIYNVRNIMTYVRDGDEATLDGFTGEIKIIRKN
ncbi:PEP/pyruvate-binding domain-containing protein [Haloimpatiens massiliensis]|uniref:PEP/pyruvate-binding domain-containing protein n=1 Tax=Haloimpatiens massiliensis TaxID=1658110 RepID=UPI0015E10097|nr:PEP/pyruvate-binding domain-containing protein [Haloimpatiens massiliensis]